MTNFEKTGYVIPPKYCDGCIYAVGKGVGYSHRDLYIQTKKKPTPGKKGHCIHKEEGVKPRHPVWREG